MNVKQLILSAFLIFNLTLSHAQDDDKFCVFVGGGWGLLPLKLSGTMDVGATSSSHVYRHVDTSGLLSNFLVNFGLNIPFYKNDNFSIGAKLSAGFGYQFSIKRAEGLSSPFILDFPQYLYYRNYKTDFDYSIMVGYKYNKNNLPYQLFFIAFDWNINDGNDQIRLYGSPFSYNYYSLYTTGELKPFIKIREFGICFIAKLGRKNRY